MVSIASACIVTPVSVVRIEEHKFCRDADTCPSPLGTPTAFLDALVAFLRLRGIVIPSSEFKHRDGVSLFNDRLIRFSKHWVYRSTGDIVRRWDGSETSSALVAEMAQKLLEYHMLHDHYDQNIEEGLRDFLIAASQKGLPILGLREPKDMLRWLDMIVGEPGVFSDIPIMHGDQYSRTGAMVRSLHSAMSAVLTIRRAGV